MRDAVIDVVHIAASDMHHYLSADAPVMAGEHVVGETPRAMTSAESGEFVRFADGVSS